jgi:hypothetical protein
MNTEIMPGVIALHPVEAWLLYERHCKAKLGLSVSRFEDRYDTGWYDHGSDLHTTGVSVSMVRCRRPTQDEWDEWLSWKLNRPRCERNPKHLVGSSDHNRECVIE